MAEPIADPTPTEDARRPPVDPGDLPEFRIVVRHPNRRGPLGPYRLGIAVAVVVAVLGPSFYSMIRDRTPDDLILLRAGAIGLLVWFTLGIVSTALESARPTRRPESERPSTG